MEDRNSISTNVTCNKNAVEVNGTFAWDNIQKYKDTSQSTEEPNKENTPNQKTEKKINTEPANQETQETKSANPKRKPNKSTNQKSVKKNDDIDITKALTGADDETAESPYIEVLHDIDLKIPKVHTLIFQNI
jgi:hypothetical protein